MKENQPCKRCGSTRKCGIKVKRCADCNKKWVTNSLRTKVGRDNRNSDPCAICTKPMDPPIYDHDEKTNKFRGWICNHCNLLLGHAFNDITILLAAIKYLNRTKLKEGS